MENVNYEALHSFVEGLRYDLDNLARTQKSMHNAYNGRLYSENGIISYSSIKGTKKIYENQNILNILGYCAFDDELVIIVKYKKNGTETSNGSTVTETVEKLLAYNKTVNVPFSNSSAEFTMGSSIELTSYDVDFEENDFENYNYNQPFSCVDGSGEQIDYSEYFTEIISSDITICRLIERESYDNNRDYLDAFVSVNKDSDGNFVGKVIWKGYLNLSMDSKICTYGINENSFYKRVYFTDYENPFRVINIRDSKLLARTTKEFEAFQSSALLSPIIREVKSGGQIKSGTTIYAFRLISENGQVTEFSPFSDAVKILKESDDGVKFSGGDISETTSRMVTIRCNIPDYKNYKEVEAIVIEYEALGAPTSIRTLGIKKTSAFVDFNHYGTESQFDKTITLSEILSRNNSWKYCSDFTAKKNKLIASGLRNDPLSNTLMNLQKDFALHSWDENGETHHCLMNPKPWKYRLIDPSDKRNMYFVEEKLYEYIKSFGNIKVKLVNKLTHEYFEKFFISENKTAYIDFTESIYSWLNEIDSSSEFASKFPNLKFENVQGKIVFKPIIQNLQTDFSNYIFEYSHKQVIEETDEKIVFRNLTGINTNNLIYGAQSLGFNRGNGIRITFITEQDEVLKKATSKFNASDKILDISVPSQKKGFFKGEIYRLGFQVYDTSGYQLFNIPIGDLKIPEIGEQKKYLDESGNIVIEQQFYQNSKVVGNSLMAERIILKVEVRLSCELQQSISMHQLTYVERTEENRSILCQGISAPMERVNTFPKYIQLKDAVANKWNLPFNGGPTYDADGLWNYDTNGPKHDNQWDSQTRVSTNRALMYFDSPDIIFNRISSERISNGFIERTARLNPDHTPASIRRRSGETFPRFSRKIFWDNIAGDGIRRSDFVDVSVFMERSGIKDLIKIEKSEKMKSGEIIPASALNTTHEVSNNALVLQRQSWFYSVYARKYESCSTDNGAKSELFASNSVSLGNGTVIIKAEKNVFTNEFIDQPAFWINPDIRAPSGATYCYDTHALINIRLDNLESIYGGRTEVSYSKNVYVPLGKTIPVLKSSNAIQSFKVHGDTYTTLYIRNKNSYNNDAVRVGWKLNNSGGCENAHEEHGEEHNGAWNYAYVVECSFEPKWTHKDTFYKAGAPFDFQRAWDEAINESYYQENTLRSYIPKPYRFKDDPDMNNIISVSKTKMNGDYIDSWSVFSTNDFYEVEKDKGTAYNLAKFLDQIYVIQERQTSLLSLDENVMMNTSDGQVSVQQGTGSSISGHTIISDYGTSIRRAVVEKSQNTKEKGGFSFIDEKKFEWLNINQPLLFERNLHLKFKEIFNGDKIIDTEGYFDDHYKETNIRIRTEKGANFVLSYNDALEVFNGYIDYDNDIYMVWDNKVFSPKKDTEHLEMHQLNDGIFLKFFDIKKTMKIGITVNINPTNVKIFKHWCGILNIDYPIKEMVIKTSSGQCRTISGYHYRYQIKEGRHSVPQKNRMDWEDLRGEWATVDIEVESRNNKKVDVFSFINFVRHSFQ